MYSVSKSCICIHSLKKINQELFFNVPTLSHNSFLHQNSHCGTKTLKTNYTVCVPICFMNYWYDSNHHTHMHESGHVHRYTQKNSLPYSVVPR